MDFVPSQEMSRRTRTIWIRSEWAFVFQTHCARRRTPLLETCGVCLIEDPLAITNPPIREVKFQQRYQMRHRKSRDEDALCGFNSAISSF